jgi:hypothetical protein
LERTIRQIRSDLESIEGNTALYEEANFSAREAALDFIEFDVIGLIEERSIIPGQAHEIAALRLYAEAVKSRLEEANEALFQKLRTDIRAGHLKGAELKRQIAAYAGSGSTEEARGDEIGYDSIDAFVNGILLIGVAPEETRARRPEMVPYQPTPARVILELAEKADLKQDDVFFDVGSGLGQVAILVNLLSGVRTKGVEFEPAYCNYARRCAEELNLPDVEFINADASEMEYSDGTVFYIYTPFVGELLQKLLEKLKGEARKRTIGVYTYGTLYGPGGATGLVKTHRPPRRSCAQAGNIQKWLKRPQPGRIS